MSTNMKSAISFYTPMLIEEQLSLKENFSGDYLMDFRVSSNTSEAMIRSMSSLIYENVPMTKISDSYSDSGAQLLNNKVLAKSIPKEVKKHLYGDKDWDKETNQGLYTDLLIECSLDVPEGKKIQVFWSITSAVYVVCNRVGRITSISPLLQRMVANWVEVNGREPENKDFFGSSLGILGSYNRFYSGQGDNAGYSVTEPGTCTVDIVGNYVYGATDAFCHTGSYFKVYLHYPEDPYSSNVAPVFVSMITEGWEMDIYKQGGSVTTNTVTGPQADLTIIQKNETGPLKGRALPGNYVTAEFPNKISRTTISDPYGAWSIDYPESPLTEEQLASISVSQSSDSGGGFSSNTAVNPTVQTSYGLPILKEADKSLPGGLYGRVSNLIQRERSSERGLNNGFSHRYENSLSGVSSSHIFKKGAPKYLLSAIYVGRRVNNPRLLENKDTFLSKPGSVVNQIAMDVNYGARLVDESDFTPPLESEMFPNEVLTASAVLPGFETRRQIFNISYESENMSSAVVRYRISYEKSYENTRDIYTLKWGLFTELVKTTQKWRLTWDSDMPFKTVTEYYMRFEVKLPEEVLTKQFYTVSWDRDLSDSYVQLIKLAYEVDQYRPRIYTWEFNWETVLIDQAVIKPYYVKRSIGNKFVDCISFQVYVDYAYAETFMATNRMFFYFSNPPKYELIQFDYNMRPYEDVFMEDLKDPSMNNRDDVPERFVFLGNYTIKDVDINNSFSLDILAEENQMNEHRSYWVPENLEDYESTMITLKDGKSKALPLDYKFRDDHHTDIVELDLVILTGAECCFTQKSIGSRCSPY